MAPRNVDRPYFHVMPKQGWMNDPNGPLFYKGKYHLFYQHLVQGCEWGFGLVWGHAVSSDLIHWEHLPEALSPTAGSVDADGCFSGCAVVNSDGQPVLLFTGVRLRNNPDCGPLPLPDYDLELPFVETQCCAIAEPGDDNLTSWSKRDMPVISLPPKGMRLAGWRDPFIIQRGDGCCKPWVMLLGSGLKNGGGAALVYTSLDLLSDWNFHGLLGNGNGDTGLVWECPILHKLQPLPHSLQAARSHTLGLFTHTSSQTQLYRTTSSGGLAETVSHSPVKEDPAGCNDLNNDVEDEGAYFFCISPDAPTNPVLYWLGSYNSSDITFDVEHADGPHRLDLGDVLYAPNTLQDDQGRLLLWGWMQERRKVGTYEYAGCLTVARLMHVHNGQLYQRPVEEMEELRSGDSWHESNVTLYAEEATPLSNVGGHHLDIEVSFNQGTATATGVMLKCFDFAMGEGNAVLLYHWERRYLELVVEGLHPDTLQYSMDAPSARRMGGELRMKAGDTLQLRLLIDYSCLEVYCGSGEVLSTRVYRGNMPYASDSGISFVSYGGNSMLARVAAYEMSSIWKQQQQQGFQDASLDAVREHAYV